MKMLRMAWTGEPIKYDGPFWQYDLPAVGPRTIEIMASVNASVLAVDLNAGEVHQFNGFKPDGNPLLQ